MTLSLTVTDPDSWSYEKLNVSLYSWFLYQPPAEQYQAPTGSNDWPWRYETS